MRLGLAIGLSTSKYAMAMLDVAILHVAMGLIIHSRLVGLGGGLITCQFIIRRRICIEEVQLKSFSQVVFFDRLLQILSPMCAPCCFPWSWISENRVFSAESLSPCIPKAEHRREYLCNQLSLNMMRNVHLCCILVYPPKGLRKVR